MLDKSFILKFSQSTEQTEGFVKRVVGFVEAKNSLPIFDSVDLDANPRSAKVGNVTTDIIDSIANSKNIFPFKTKGILMGSSHHEALQRRRYRVSITDSNVEGVLDGGHNMLAIGLYILRSVLDEDREYRQIKTWPQFKESWTTHRKEIETIKNDLNFLIPIEILFPSDSNDSSIVEEFNDSLLDICAARNNNVELTLETKANKKGFYNYIQQALTEDLGSKIEWKTNDGGTIPVRDLIALSWIPLNKLSKLKLLPSGFSVVPQNIYRNKGECSKLFDRLMHHKDICESVDGNYEYKLHNNSIKSAFKILSKIPSLYDKIYIDFPEAYNSSTKGRFGRNPIVRIYDASIEINESNSKKYLRREPSSKFFNKPLKYRYPDGLIMPLVVGLSALIDMKNNELFWKTDPDEFLNKWLKEITKSYKFVLDMSDFDPQKVGKNETSYALTYNLFEGCLLKHESQKS